MRTGSVPRKPTVVTSSAAFEADRTYAASSPLKRVLMGTSAAPAALRTEGGDDPAEAVGRPDRDAIAPRDARRQHGPGRDVDELPELAVRHPSIRLHDGLGVGPRRDARRHGGRDRLGESLRCSGGEGTWTVAHLTCAPEAMAIAMKRRVGRGTMDARHGEENAAMLAVEREIRQDIADLLVRVRHRNRSARLGAVPHLLHPRLRGRLRRHRRVARRRRHHRVDGERAHAALGHTLHRITNQHITVARGHSSLRAATWTSSSSRPTIGRACGWSASTTTSWCAQTKGGRSPGAASPRVFQRDSLSI